MKKSYGLDDPSRVVDELARRLDADKTKLILVETAMQKSTGSSSYAPEEPAQQFNQPNVQPTIDFNAQQKQDCQDRVNKYTTCMVEYQGSLNDYQECLNKKLLNKYLFCYKPIQLCGLKPICF